MLDKECLRQWAAESGQRTPPTSTRLETLTLREVLEKARNVLVNTWDKHLAAAARPEQTLHTPNIHKSGQSDVTCFRCGGPEPSS